MSDPLLSIYLEQAARLKREARAVAMSFSVWACKGDKLPTSGHVANFVDDEYSGECSDAHCPHEERSIIRLMTIDAAPVGATVQWLIDEVVNILGHFGSHEFLALDRDAAQTDRRDRDAQEELSARYEELQEIPDVVIWSRRASETSYWRREVPPLTHELLNLGYDFAFVVKPSKCILSSSTTAIDGTRIAFPLCPRTFQLPRQIWLDGPDVHSDSSKQVSSLPIDQNKSIHPS